MVYVGVTGESEGMELNVMATALVRRWTRQEYDVRIQLPLALDPSSEPEPDVTVVRGSPRDYRDAHPASALLVVEVADTTLLYDREQKGSLYARAGVAEYWLVNILERSLEVYREPAPLPQAHYGWGYQTVEHYRAVVSSIRTARRRV